MIRVRLKKKTILLTFNKLTSSAANGKELVGKTTLHHALGFAAWLVQEP
jgi:hypothetical protein